MRNQTHIKLLLKEKLQRSSIHNILIKRECGKDELYFCLAKSIDMHLITWYLAYRLILEANNKN